MYRAIFVVIVLAVVFGAAPVPADSHAQPRCELLQEQIAAAWDKYHEWELEHQKAFVKSAAIGVISTESALGEQQSLIGSLAGQYRRECRGPGSVSHP